MGGEWSNQKPSQPNQVYDQMGHLVFPIKMPLRRRRRRRRRTNDALLRQYRGEGRRHGCQMAKARFLDRMCLALQASGIWLRYATLQKLIPSFPWIVPGWRVWGASGNLRGGGTKACQPLPHKRSSSLCQSGMGTNCAAFIGHLLSLGSSCEQTATKERDVKRFH